MTTQAKFWFVWNPQGNAPRYKHETRSAAVAEAERLARLYPGEFVVLESVASVQRVDVEWSRHEPEYASIVEDSDDELPF